MRQLTKQEIYDILFGCTILGTGGGGSLKSGLRMVDEMLDLGKKFTLASLDEISDEDLIVTAYYCGAISPETEESKRIYEHLPQISGEAVIKAVQVLEGYISESINGIISTELGGENTACALYTAAYLDKFVLDADPTGRSVPELQHSTYYINGVKITPIAVVNNFGESVIVREVVDDYRAEALVRSIANVSNNNVAVADHLAKGRIIKKSVIPGAVTYALNIGKAFREAYEKNENQTEAVASAGNGLVVYEGIVNSFQWNTINAFTVGDVNFEGTGSYIGKKLKIWFKNENIMSWLDGKPFVQSPDLICLFDGENNMPISNPNYVNGMSVKMVALPAPSVWTTDRALQVFSARYFGFDVDYVPFQKIIQAKS